MGTWHDPDLGRPIAAPLERCAELLGVDLATVRQLATGIEPYRRADGIEVWSPTPAGAAAAAGGVRHAPGWLP